MLFIHDNGNKKGRGSSETLEASHCLPTSLSSSHCVSASLSYLALSDPYQQALSACPYLTVVSTNIVNRIARRVEGEIGKCVHVGKRGSLIYLWSSIRETISVAWGWTLKREYSDLYICCIQSISEIYRTIKKSLCTWRLQYTWLLCTIGRLGSRPTGPGGHETQTDAICYP
jgi:hypothetical protein